MVEKAVKTAESPIKPAAGAVGSAGTPVGTSTIGAITVHEKIVGDVPKLPEDESTFAELLPGVLIVKAEMTPEGKLEIILVAKTEAHNALIPDQQTRALAYALRFKYGMPSAGINKDIPLNFGNRNGRLIRLLPSF